MSKAELLKAIETFFYDQTRPQGATRAALEEAAERCMSYAETLSKDEGYDDE